MTVHDVLQLSALLAPRVIAGEQGLARTINWFHIIDIPQLLPWLSEGDIVFSSGYALHLSADMLDGMVEGLDKKGIRGLFLAEDVYLQEIPSSLLEEANSLNFPVVVFAAETKLRDVTYQLAEQLLNLSDQFLPRYIEFQRNITQIMATSKDPLPQILKMLGDALRADVLLLDAIGDPIYPSNRNGKFDSFLKHFRKTHLDQSISEDAHLAGFFMSAYFYRVLTCNTSVYLVVMRPLNSLITQEIILLNGIVSIIVTLFAHSGHQASPSEHANVPLLERILNRPSALDTATEAKISAQGWHLNETHVVIIFQLVDYTSHFINNRMNDRQIRELYQRLSSELERQIYGLQGIYPILKEDDCFITLVKLSSTMSEKVLAAQCGDITAELEQEFGVKLLAGISSVSRHQEMLSKKLLEAREVLSVLKTMRGLSVSRYEQVTLDIMLNRIIADVDVCQSYRIKISALKAYDALHTSELISTLRVFSSNNGNTAKTARVLNVHRNTILYRLQKIEELTGIFSSSENYLLNISILLKIYDQTLQA